MNWYLKVLKQYADFSGRARRKEYWIFVLFNMVIGIISMIFSELLYITYLIATIVPSLAVGVRRLHDVGKSGWMSLIVLIPLVGAIWLLILLCTDSQLENNKWGQNPKEIVA